SSYVWVKSASLRRYTSLSICCLVVRSHNRQLSGENSSARIILPSLKRPNSSLKSTNRKLALANNGLSKLLTFRQIPHICASSSLLAILRAIVADSLIKGSLSSSLL